MSPNCLKTVSKVHQAFNCSTVELLLHFKLIRETHEVTQLMPQTASTSPLNLLNTSVPLDSPNPMMPRFLKFWFPMCNGGTLRESNESLLHITTSIIIFYLNSLSIIFTEIVIVKPPTVNSTCISKVCPSLFTVGPSGLHFYIHIIYISNMSMCHGACPRMHSDE